MSESEAVSAQADLEALRALQADAPEFDRIESLLDRFNVFETIGFVNDEGLHSRFLAFLLDPKRNDGLSDRFIKGLVRETLAKAQAALQPSTFASLDRAQGDLDSMDLSETLVRREHYAIDILLTNEGHRLAIIIENKIRAGEGRGQLEKYDTFVRYTYPGWDVLKIYLTPSGAAPSHNEYVRLSYGVVCGIVDRILEESGSSLSPDVRVPMEHYAQMVRRKILGDPEIVSLSQRLYRKHKRAFDLVYSHRPDYRTQIRPIIEELIREHPKLEQEPSTLDTIRFGVVDWDTPDLLTSSGWTQSGRILMFILYNRRDSLDLHLYMGPGSEEIRQRIVGMAGTNPDTLLKPPNAKPRWISIFHRPLLEPKAYEDLSDEERERELRGQWSAFISEDLPRIETVLKEEGWVRGAVEESGST